MPSDHFSPTPLPQLLQIILNQYEKTRSIFGIPDEMFFRPLQTDPFRSRIYGQLLETPLGVAAGPHTQLSQNIVAAWLTGARFIELKTVQTLDELQVSKPCIDMQDEGYNCEWSQELKIHQSFDQYLDAWILIHILRDKLDFGAGKEPGCIFNMSVGYNLDGILNDNVQWFFSKMKNASAELKAKMDAISQIYPRISQLKINPCLSDNITLSTMHGCPPDEIEAIGRYLIEHKKLHTNIKLNPTLLGKERLQRIVSDSGFSTIIPDQAFEHDLKYQDAISIIQSLCSRAILSDVRFGLKLTNTLESVNHKDIFPASEKMMYMSGRALHPVSVAIARDLQHEFGGRFNISFCGGADAFNIASLVDCGLSPVTVCSDLLKPGGYGRLNQYISELRNSFAAAGCSSIEDYILSRSGNPDQKISEAILQNLDVYVEKAINDPAYRKNGFHDPSIKTGRSLGWFDCISAPCEDTCPTNQDIAAYNYHAAKGDFKKAAEVVMQTNPFPQTTGMICDHLCQLKCTRINYDHPVLIREIKRFVAENHAESAFEEASVLPGRKMKRAAIIGAGPSGLSCAAFLARAGFHVQVFETKNIPGGMVSSGIPSFRLTNDAILNDVGRIEALGVQIHYNQEITSEKFEQLQLENDYIYIAAGAQRSARLNIEGIEAEGVLDPLHFLENLKNSKAPALGEKVLIIGGGNTAMDVARTAWRLVGEHGKVSIVYRRTIREMPADLGEVKAVIEEGMEIFELTAPVKVNVKDGKIASLTCRKMKLGKKDASGRPRPELIPDSDFEIPADTIIPAVGQELAIDFCDVDLLRTKGNSYETLIPGVFIGGDAMRGASTAINAIGDGRKAAQEIILQEKAGFNTKPVNVRSPQELNWHIRQRAQKVLPAKASELAADERKNFRLVSATLNREEVVHEANRCLLCDEVCNVCVSVCPNLAFYSYKTEPQKWPTFKLQSTHDGWESVNVGAFEVSQPYQILHLADWCNNCGNCNTFCPTADAPNQVKPHLFFQKQVFDAEPEGFYIEDRVDSAVLHHKKNGHQSKLYEEPDRLVYEINEGRVYIDKKSLEISGFDLSDPADSAIDLTSIPSHALILKGAKQFFGW